MKIFLDTEFIEDGKTIDLMSIGMIREDGLRYYAVSNECDISRASDWVRENVIPYLFSENSPQQPNYKSRNQIKQDLLEFCGDSPEFWGYYSDYDWVAICQLFGTMMDLPAHFPMFCLDLKQTMYLNGIEKESLKVEASQEHNALADAIELKEMYDKLRFSFRCASGFNIVK